MTRLEGWTKKFKGSRERGGAWIYTHPDALDGRAIVQNHNGIFFNGQTFVTLEEAGCAALKATEDKNHGR